MNKSHARVVRLAISLLFVIGIRAHAQHYPAGSEGIKAGSLPPPGVYVRDDNSFYTYSRYPGFDAQIQNIIGTRYTYGQTPRLMWMTGWAPFGIDLGIAARIPFTYEHYTDYGVAPTGEPPNGGFPPSPGPAKMTTERRVGLADIQIEPLLLSWMSKHFDLSGGYSFWAPTGDYNKNRFFIDNIGQGYWTHSIMLGATWYLDSKKTWAISLLNHYDINTGQYSSLVTVNPSATHPLGAASETTALGDIDTLEWGVSKAVGNVDLGLTGYYQQQVTATQGPTFNGPTWRGERVRVAGIGPEVEYTCPEWGVTASLRYAYEFTAMDHSQGNLITLSLTKGF